MLWARTNERRASSELVMPGPAFEHRQRGVLGSRHAGRRARTLDVRTQSELELFDDIREIAVFHRAPYRRPFRVTPAGGSEGGDGMLGRGRTEVGAIAFEAALQLGHLDGASCHIAVEREVGGGSRGLSHHEAGAGHAAG